MVDIRRSSRLNPSAPSRSPSPPPPPPKRGRTSHRGGRPAASGNKEKGDVGGHADASDVDMQDASVDAAPADKKSGATKPAKSKRKLVETEPDTDVPSEAATGNLARDSATVSSELSSLEDPVEETPRPKKKIRSDGQLVPDNIAVSHPRHTGATATNHMKTHADKKKLTGKELGAKTIRPNNTDIAAFMNIAPDVISLPSSIFPHNETLTARRAFLSEGSSKSSTTSGSSKAPSVASIRTSGSGSSFRSPGSSRAVTGSSSESSHAPRVTVNRTRTLPPAPLTKPPKPSQARPFELNTTKMAKGKKKAQLETREEGIVESDKEEVERSAAWLSPPKKGARATSAHLVKIKEPKIQINVQEPTPRKSDGNKGKKIRTSSVRDSQPERDETSGEDSDNQFVTSPSQALQVPQPNRNRSRSRSESPSNRFRLEDLPGYPQSVRAWKKYFVPTLLLFQGAQPQPWNWQDSVSVPLVQAIWNACLGDEFPLKVIQNECVHSLANQKLWDWRSSLRHAAEVVVGHYLDQSPHTLDAQNRGAFCQKIIEGARFLYQNPLGQKTTRLFESQFMLAVLAVHLDATKSAIDVPGFKYPKGTSPDLQIRAIGLAAAALERIFTLYASCFMQREEDEDGDEDEDEDRDGDEEDKNRKKSRDKKSGNKKNGDNKKKKKKKKNGLWKPIPQLNPNTGKFSTSYSDFCELRFRGPTEEYSERAGKMSHSRISAILNAAKEYMGRRSAGEHAGFDEVEVRGRNELADDEDEDDDH